MKGYKGFNKDMTCRGFQYEQGKTYETGLVELCHRGFHFCERLRDCFDFYDAGDSIFCEIEAEGIIVGDGKKNACSKITIGREVTPIELNRTKYGYGYGDGYGDGNGYGNGDGNGYGDGDGYGYGYGNGYGDGYGDGNGYGYGNGYGNGDGNGDGYGDGNGNGYGNGDGYGDGYGNGYGNGDGNGKNIQKILIFKEVS